MSNKPRVLVLGAAGQAGGSVASLLSEQPQLDVVAAARNPAAFARDRRQGTKIAPDFSDAVMPYRLGCLNDLGRFRSIYRATWSRPFGLHHHVIDAICCSSATGKFIHVRHR